MHCTIHVAIKESVHKLKKVDICKALIHKSNLPSEIQTNRWTGPVFRISVGGPAKLKVELPSSKEALIKQGCGCHYELSSKEHV